jgi:nuclear pore complex protein Nup98-Nup96
VAAGHSHALALPLDGSGVYAWGRSDRGQTGQATTVPLFPQPAHSSTPTLVDFPRGDAATPLPPCRLVDVAAGSHHGLAKTQEGDVYAWGANDRRQLGLENRNFHHAIVAPNKLELKAVGSEVPLKVIQMVGGIDETHFLVSPPIGPDDQHWHDIVVGDEVPAFGFGFGGGATGAAGRANGSTGPAGGTSAFGVLGADAPTGVGFSVPSHDNLGGGTTTSGASRNFGATPATTPSGLSTFGAPSAVPAGFFGGRAASAATEPSSTPPFGSPLFGSSSGFSNGAFGARASASAFGGASGNSGEMFGASAPAFGSTSETSAELLGALASAFAGNSGSSRGLFGAPAPASGSTSGISAGLFGAPASAFGSPPGNSSGLFGARAEPAFGSPSGNSSGLFGAPASGSTLGIPTAVFGAPAPALGSPSGNSGGFFGAPAPAPAFGITSGNYSGFFGAPVPAPALGSTSGISSGVFGAPVPAQVPLAGGFFGSDFRPTGPSAGHEFGTRHTPFAPSSRQDGTTAIQLHSITAMPPYEDYMFEELRVQDYMSGNRGSATGNDNATATPVGSTGPGNGETGPAPSASIVWGRSVTGSSARNASGL